MTKAHARRWLVAGTLALLVGYVLSPGPVIRLMDLWGGSGSGYEDFLEVVYFPLQWLYRHVGWVEGFYDWWFEVCGL